MTTPSSPLRTALTALAAGVVLLLSIQSVEPQAQPNGARRVSQPLRDRAARGERVRVLVALNLPGHVSDGTLPNVATRLGQRQRLSTLQDRVLSRLSPAAHRIIHRYTTVPYLAVEVNANALAALENTPADVIQVMDDAIVWPVLSESVPLIQGDQAWEAGYDGTGTTIAILDTGVETSHPLLAGKVVEEACYSSNQPGVSSSFCPNGLSQQIGPGAATPCPLEGCLHGTHVAGIAAGNGAGTAQSLSGVARGAQLMAVQVFSQIDDFMACGGAPPCLGGFTSDIIAGLERVYAVAPAHHIVAANMSLGEGQFFAQCDSEPYKPIIDSLRAIGVASIVAAGNDGHTSSMMTPACVSSAISVGATDDSDQVTWFSNVAPFLSLFAPGDDITSAIPNGDIATLSGTSMAAPHVAGAWAVLKQAAPAASVTAVLASLRETGRPISDTRAEGTVTVPRVNTYEALASLVPVSNPTPEITALSPDRVRATGPRFTLTVTGSGFNVFSVVRWNGADRPTTVVSTTMLRASIEESDLDLDGAGTAEITVFAPTPGGGISSALILPIDPPPSISVDASTVAPGGSVTMTLVDGYGGTTDRLTFAPVDAPDTSSIQWRFIGTGYTTRTWTVTVPTTEGQYEFRLFVNDVRKATSPTVTVAIPPNPPPVVSALSPAHTVVGGTAFTLTITGADFVQSSAVRWNNGDRPTTFVSATQLQAAIDAADIATAGPAAVSVFSPEPGGGTSASLTFTVDPAPVLAVNATSVAAGAPVTVTLSNGLGGATDWLALAATSAPNTSYTTWTYVGAGVTARTWTVNMPATPGTYEVRLFKSGGFTRLATSPAVAVVAPAPVLNSLSPTAGPVGGAAFTLTVNGGGFMASSVVRWNGADRPTTYVSGAQLQAAIPASDLATIGTAQVVVFTPAPGGGTSPALTFTISQPPSLAVSATSAAAGAQVTVTLTNGFGGASDWLALAVTSAPNTSYLQWTYVGTGVTTRTWTVTMPASAGAYEFRLFVNGFTRAATSPAVNVMATASPALTVSTTSAAAGSPVIVTLTNGPGGSTDWLAFAAAGAPDNTYLQSVSVGPGVTSRTWTVTTPSTAGAYEFRLFVNGNTRLATSPAVNVTAASPAALAVSASSVSGGTPVTVTLTNGPGGSSDWLALATTGAPNNSYLQWVYVGAGVTTRTWTVNMPAAAGTYEFRLFVSGYTRVATSPTVSVASAALAVNATTVAGGTPATVTLTNGPGGSSDWLALARTGAPDNSYLQWVYVGAGVTTRTWTVTMPTTAGTYEFRLFVNGYTRVATSPTVSVTAAALSVNASSVAAGTPVTVTLTDGPGGSTDWLALAATGAPSNGYLQWVYVGAGVTTRTWTVNMPAAAGTYEFRLFLNNGYTRAATSPPVTVTP